MIQSRLASLRQTVKGLFPERHLHLRSGGEMHDFVLSTRKQVAMTGVAAGVLGWAAMATLGAAGGAVALSASEQETAELKAEYQAQLADREARLTAAVAQLKNTRGHVDELASTVESRHAALAMVMTELKDQPGALDTLKPSAVAAKPGASPAERIRAVQHSQAELIDKADGFAKTRTDRLKLAFRVAGVRPAAVKPQAAGGRGGPLIETSDPRALAAVLDIDEDFARRVSRVARSVVEMRALTASAESLPLAKPVEDARLTSGYGVRFDPFTTNPAFHAGQDFGGAHMTPINATAPGRVVSAGPRAGYGNMVEVDHGRGFRTRYAHLAKIHVRPGQAVTLGQSLGGMGSTGRSTGTHLHYEVWVNGRAQNPSRYLKAGQYVREG